MRCEKRRRKRRCQASHQTEAKKDGKQSLRLAHIEEIAGEKPELEKYQALHQIARDVELAVDEPGRAGSEGGRYQENSRKDNQDAGEELRAIETVNDGNDDDADKDEGNGASHIHLGKRVWAEVFDEKGGDADVEEAVRCGQEEVQQAEREDQSAVTLEDVESLSEFHGRAVAAVPSTPGSAGLTAEAAA